MVRVQAQSVPRGGDWRATIRVHRILLVLQQIGMALVGFYVLPYSVHFGRRSLSFRIFGKFSLSAGLIDQC